MGRHNHRDRRHYREHRSTLLDIFDVVQRYLPEEPEVRYFVSYRRKIVIKNMAAWPGVTRTDKISDDLLFEELLNAT